MAAVIAFISQKGGVGKSTLARALAAVCAQAGLEVVLADLDPRQQTLVHWQKARTRAAGLTASFGRALRRCGRSRRARGSLRSAHS